MFLIFFIHKICHAIGSYRFNIYYHSSKKIQSLSHITGLTSCFFPYSLINHSSYTSRFHVKRLQHKMNDFTFLPYKFSLQKIPTHNCFLKLTEWTSGFDKTWHSRWLLVLLFTICGYIRYFDIRNYWPI